LGTLCAGYIFDFSPKAPFYLAAAGAALLPALFLIFPPLSNHNDAPVSLPPESHPHQHPVHLTIARVTNLCFWFALGILRNLFPKLALTLNLNAAWLGILLAAISLSMSAVFVLFIFTHFWHFRYRLLVFSQFLAMAGLILIAVSSSTPLLLLGFIMMGVASGHSYSAGLYYALYFSKKPGEAEPSTVGHNTGIHEFFIGVGGFLGPLLGGPTARYIHLRGPYVLSCGIILIGMAVGWTLMKRATSRPA
jgi:MFS family permease